MPVVHTSLTYLSLILVYLASMAWISFLNYISVGQQ